MRKTSGIALLTLGVALAACSDSTMAPKTDAARPQSVHGGGVAAALSQTDTMRTSITINPHTRTYWDLGSGNSITFPAHSLCDPSTSTYGIGEWDKPCDVATKSQNIQVKAWIDGAGHPRVDFTPNVRFVPSSDPYNWVVLTFSDVAASLDPFFNIDYCPVLTSNDCINEALTDPSVATVHDPVTGKVTRRVKHFSGYNVAAGDSYDGSLSAFNRTPTGGRFAPSAPNRGTAPSVEPDNNTPYGNDPSRSEGEVLYRQILREYNRSGYILASG